MKFVESIQQVFEQHANHEIAVVQCAYMKNRFAFYGIKTPLRQEIQKPFLDKNYLPSKEEAKEIINILWEKPQRELHYFSQNLLFKYIKQFEKGDSTFLEYLITHNSWWDTVDFLATKIIGAYLKQFPDQQNVLIQQWIDSNNIWLQRTAILFQLKYRDKTNQELLCNIILQLNESKEFFINKAIGWSLREYAKTNPSWVINFVDKNTLSNLSKREALKHFS